MPDKTYLLVVGASVSQVERLTGLCGLDTPFGVLIEEPAKNPYEGMGELMSTLRRILDPKPKGRYNIINLDMVS